MLTLDQMYKMFAKQHLDYCDVIYHVPPHQEYDATFFNLKYLMRSIESTHYQAARTVSGAWKGTNLDWQYLSERRWAHRLFQFYKIFNDFIPAYLKDLVPPALLMLYGQRRENVLHEIAFRTDSYASSFFTDCVKNWKRIGCD